MIKSQIFSKIFILFSYVNNETVKIQQGQISKTTYFAQWFFCVWVILKENCVDSTIHHKAEMLNLSTLCLPFNHILFMSSQWKFYSINTAISCSYTALFTWVFQMFFKKLKCFLFGTVLVCLYKFYQKTLNTYL